VVGARYLKGLGEEYGVDPFQHVDLAEIDGVNDARPLLESARRSGSSRGDQANYDDSAVEREERQRRRTAEQYASQECENAVDYCEDGDKGACDFLVEECGLDREEAEQMVGLSADTRDLDADDGTEQATRRVAATSVRVAA